ncbi:MAG TPA: hypothetical protein VL096_07200 [Pirellulaceae bacterium]|nr:hypothetical protein [Pirellulaceae bacterium]
MAKRISLPTLCIYVGVILLLLGLQMRAVETYEFSPDATRILAGWVGPEAGTPHAAVRQVVIDTTRPRHRMTPPAWLGWSLLSIGCVLTAHGLLRSR